MTTTTAQEPTVTVPSTLTIGEAFTHSVPRGWAKYTFQEISFEGFYGTEVIGLLVDGEPADLCKRCGQGYGHFSWNGEDDICYSCSGEGYGAETTLESMERRAKARSARQRRASEKAAKEAQRLRDEHAAWVAANADLAEALVAHRTPEQDEDGYFVGKPYDWTFRPVNSFLTKMADQARYSPLTERQAAAAQDALDKLTERNAEAVAIGHWGTVGKREIVEVKVVKTIAIEGDYGTSWLCIMEGAEGHALKTFSTGAFVDDAQRVEGTEETLKVKATVKKHDTYNGKPQTIVTRVATQA
jgi:hypothetical protein